ncbi:MAG: phospholipid-binding protein [Hyphomicrobiales bacterium]|nr:phospholipid-binding protein [Hyphomicrobiales bacterium]MCP5373993.1 phospholipid-binding protein [Hyphomicrobiales bacterium]
MRAIITAAALLATLSAAPTQAADFTITFEWGDIPLCTTGTPNTVPNPRFTLAGVPEGTKFIAFSLTDLDVPSYNHGGGTVPYTGQAVVEPGAFKYQSPCPPSGSHTYEWTAAAKKSTGFFSGSIAKARARTRYP